MSGHSPVEFGWVMPFTKTVSCHPIQTKREFFSTAILDVFERGTRFTKLHNLNNTICRPLPLSFAIAFAEYI